MTHVNEQTPWLEFEDLTNATVYKVILQILTAAFPLTFPCHYMILLS